MADERPAHEVITALFAKHGLESPPVRLRDELVAHYQAYRTKPEAREGGGGADDALNAALAALKAEV